MSEYRLSYFDMSAKGLMKVDFRLILGPLTTILSDE